MSNRSTHWAAVLLTSACLVAIGCAKAPEQEMQQTQTAVKAAETAGAETYASDSYAKAQETYRQAEAEIQAQSEKTFKSYDKAKELLAQAETEAEQAATDAAAGKERMQGEAEAAIAQARTALDAAAQAVSVAPASKDAKADLEAMMADLDTLRGLLTEAETALAAEDFAGAKAKAEQVDQEAAAISADVLQAGQPPV
jgi:hypothetical protein